MMTEKQGEATNIADFKQTKKAQWLGWQIKQANVKWQGFLRTAHVVTLHLKNDD